MILEGIVTTWDESQQVNVSPMGPVVEAEMATLRLRPYRSSRTYRNLKARGQGVFHVVDDVLLLSRAAIGIWDELPETFPAEKIAGSVLKNACRWYEFEVTALEDSQERTDIQVRIIHSGRLRDFFGFNRAKHAVLEAAILATRLHLLPREQIEQEFARLLIPIQKTAGPQEQAAFELLRNYFEKSAALQE